jgi:hypothetical protein
MMLAYRCKGHGYLRRLLARWGRPLPQKFKLQFAAFRFANAQGAICKRPSSMTSIQPLSDSNEDKPNAPPAFRPGRHLEMFDDGNDPYAQREKLSEPAVCSDCGAVYHQGRWQWLLAPPGALPVRCAACRRILEKMPAGYVAIGGAFARDHREELLQLVRNLEAKEKAEHPLQRIMAIDEHDDGLMISTTDIHLARGIGEALQHAYKGTLDYHFVPDEYLLRVRWER